MLIGIPYLSANQCTLYNCTVLTGMEHHNLDGTRCEGRKASKVLLLPEAPEHQLKLTTAHLPSHSTSARSQEPSTTPTGINFIGCSLHRMNRFGASMVSTLSGLGRS